MENYILNLLKNVVSENITVEQAYNELIGIINNIMVQTFNPNDYVLLSSNKEYRAKDGSMKKPTIFMDINGAHYLAPKDDIIINES